MDVPQFDLDANDAPFSQPKWLDTLLPASIFLTAILADVLSSIHYPKSLQTAWRWLTSPFRNFLTLEDLSEPVDRTPIDTKIKNRYLVGLASVAFIGWVGCLLFGIIRHDREYALKALVYTISWFYITLRVLIRPPLTPPYLFITFTISSVLLSLIAFGNDISVSDDKTLAILDAFAMVIPAAFAWLAGTLPLKTYRPCFNVAQPMDVPSVKLSCPEDNVNLWTWSGFTFVQPILDLAMKRTLNDIDVWSLSPFFRHKNLFHKNLEYRASHPSHSLLRFLLSSNSLDLFLDVTLEMWSAVIGFVPPYALQEILAALASDTPQGRSTAYFWTLVTFIAHLSFAQVDLFQAWHTRRCYERTRGQLFCTLHYKALRRRDITGNVQREGETENADLGKIINLMQGDSYAVAQRFWEFSGLFTSPVRIVIALTFLYQILGWSALSGVVVVLVAFFLNYPLARYDIHITRSAWKAKDKRMNIVNELLQNIRFLKFYGWEYTWSRKAQDARATELKWRVKGNIVDTAINFIWVWMPSATALISFLCYTLVAGERLTVSKAFTSIALFSQLQTPMVALPGQVSAMLQAYVSMQRIEAFLKEDEVPDWASTLSSKVVNGNGHGYNHKPEVGFSEAIFEWKEASDNDAAPSRFQLGPLDIKFPPGKLTIVSGATGSGKSALLVALLGEMHCISGEVFIDKANHQIAYCAQNPWLEHATIRDNIVFGSPAPFDEARYQAVLDACALRQDLAIFDAGDMTEIGEKGITLSGGQRARIALARAMYSQAKCILLDDPLAAVDMHTAQHLVSNCLAGDLARDRTIILVTHHITLCLPVASYLVELEKGKIAHQGTIPELEAKGLLRKVVETEDESSRQVLPTSPTSPIQETYNEVDSDEETKPRPRREPSNGKLIEAEARAEGRVTLRSYMTYLRAAGIFSWILTLAVTILIRAINIFNQVFLAQWGEAYEKEYPALTALTQFKFHYPWEGLPSPNDNVRPWLMIYLYISIAGAICVLSYIVIGYYASLQASRRLFIALIQRLTRAPARFFDVTPIGRILNRFTTDINTIDNALQASARTCLGGVLNFIASFGVILFVVPTFAPFALFIAWLYIRLAPPYIQASRDLRRLESVSLSPAFAGFDELLRGIIHIRAFGMESRYQDSFYAKVDKFQSFDHVYWLVNGWLRWRYDCLGSVIVFAATMFALWQGVTNGSAAIVIVQAGIFADASRQLVKVAAQLELDFNSVERVVEYLDVVQEAPAIVEKNRPPAYWPSTSGELVVEDLVVQYAPNLPAVLHNVSFVVKPSEKIGVVGRTGSGKSTLAMSLLRIVEPTGGKIILDGIDISILGLEDLRTRVTIVSQDVSLFAGTIRSNLDPLGKCTDEECVQVLERCHLLPLLGHKPTKDEPTVLDMRITQSSLSAGEKQLLALARAVLRHTSIIIMDEATSQIDSDLDDQIQQTIREELANAIVITIAHRLKTVMDYDRVLVLDEGRIVEFDTPHVLLSRSNGAFRRMCRKSVDWPLFMKIAAARSEFSKESDSSKRSSQGSSQGSSGICSMRWARKKNNKVNRKGRLRKSAYLARDGDLDASREILMINGSKDIIDTERQSKTIITNRTPKRRANAMRFATLAVFYPLLQLEVAGRISGRPLQYPKLAERDLLSLLGLEGSTPSIAGGDILGGVPTLGLGGGQGQGQGQNGVQPAAAGLPATTSFALPMAMSLQSPATVTGNPVSVGSPLFTSGNTIYTSPATPLPNGVPSTRIGVVSQSSLRFDGASSALPTPSAIGSLKGSGSSGSDNANGSTNGSDDYVGSDASTTPPAELTEWKVIGIAVMTITLIGTIVLSVTFFDQWWGFLRAVVCGRRARRKRDAEMFGMGGEEMVPDWNRQSWKFKLDSEYGHRYPDMGTFGSQGGKEKVKEEVLGKGTKKAKGDDRESQKKQTTTSTLSPEVFPRL